MKLEIRDKWLKALKSGDYTQGQGTLCNFVEHSDGKDKKFCCLGVLCDIMGVSYKDVHSRRGYYDELYTNKDFQYLPSLFRAQIVHITEEQQTELVYLNDEESSPNNFNDIAYWIEENL